MVICNNNKIHIHTFWYWLTRVVPEKGPLNVCVCVCVCVCACVWVLVERIMLYKLCCL